MLDSKELFCYEKEHPLDDKIVKFAVNQLLPEYGVVLDSALGSIKHAIRLFIHCGLSFEESITLHNAYDDSLQKSIQKLVDLGGLTKIVDLLHSNLDRLRRLKCSGNFDTPIGVLIRLTTYCPSVVRILLRYDKFLEFVTLFGAPDVLQLFPSSDQYEYLQCLLFSVIITCMKQFKREHWKMLRNRHFLQSVRIAMTGTHGSCAYQLLLRLYTNDITQKFVAAVILDKSVCPLMEGFLNVVQMVQDYLEGRVTVVCSRCYVLTAGIMTYVSGASAQVWKILIECADIFPDMELSKKEARELKVIYGKLLMCAFGNIPPVFHLCVPRPGPIYEVARTFSFSVSEHGERELNPSELTNNHYDHLSCSSPKCNAFEDGKNNRFRVCNACKHAWYCSKQCQRVHWKSGHRAYCKARAAIPK
eukprot:179231_1